jgi:hypothetical protein
LEKLVQVPFRLRDLGIDDPETTAALIDELHMVTRLREESAAHSSGTLVPEDSRIIS